MFKTRSKICSIVLLIAAVISIKHLGEGDVTLLFVKNLKFCKTMYVTFEDWTYLLSKFSFIISTADKRFCPENEFYTECGASCQTECATLNKPCLIVNKRCPDGCYCNKGYARDANRICIPISECPFY